MTKQSQDLNLTIHFLWYIICHIPLPTQPLYTEREMTHNLFPWLLRQLFLSPFSLSVSFSLFFVSLDSSGWFFHLSIRLLWLFQRRRENPACFSVTQKTAAKRSCDEDFVYVAHTEWGGPRALLLVWLGCILSIRPCSCHFQRAWTGLWGALKSMGGESGIHADSCVESAGWAVDKSACPCLPPSCPGDQAGLETCMAQRSPHLIVFIQPGFLLPALSLALVG